MAETGVDFSLVHRSAEAVPLPDESFGMAFRAHSFAIDDPVEPTPGRTPPAAAR